MGKINILIAFIFAFTLSPQAQSVADEPAKIAELGTRLAGYSDSLLDKTVKRAKDLTEAGEEDVADIEVFTFNAHLESFQKEAEPLVKDVMANGNESQRKCARYLNTFMKYLIAYAYYAENNTEKAQRLMKEISGDMDFFSERSIFPITYKSKEDEFEISFSMFEPFWCMYNYYYGTLLYPRSNVLFAIVEYRQCLNQLKKVISRDCLRPADKFIAYNYMQYSKSELSQIDAELAGYSAKVITVYADFTAEQKKQVTGPETALSEAVTLLKKKELLDGNSVETGTTYFEAADGLRSMNDSLVSNAALFYSAAMKKGRNSYSDLKHIIYFAQVKNYTELRREAAFQLEQKINRNDCKDLKMMGQEFSGIAETAKAAEYEKLAAKCEKDQAKEAKKHSRNSSSRSSSSHDGKFNFYAGFNITSLFNTPAKMDFGGDLAFIYKKFGVDVSFLYIRQNKEWASDVKGEPTQYWNGYRTYLGFKGYSVHTKGFYVGIGPQFGFAFKQLNTITSAVTDNNSASVSTYNFNAKENQYHFLINFDIYGFVKFFGIHLFGGLGFSYNHFDGGRPEYNNAQYTIQDLLLSQRKPGRFALQLRGGISIGFRAKSKK